MQLVRTWRCHMAVHTACTDMRACALPRVCIHGKRRTIWLSPQASVVPLWTAEQSRGLCKSPAPVHGFTDPT